MSGKSTFAEGTGDLDAKARREQYLRSSFIMRQICDQKWKYTNFMAMLPFRFESTALHSIPYEIKLFFFRLTGNPDTQNLSCRVVTPVQSFDQDLIYVLHMGNTNHQSICYFLML